MDTLKLAMNAEAFLETFRLPMQSGLGFPLTVMLGALSLSFLRLFSVNDPVFAVNFMSVIFGSLSVGVFYLWVKKCLNMKTALFGSLLFSVSPIFWGLSVYGKSHTPCVFFLLTGLYLWARAAEQRSVRLLVLGAISLGFMGAARVVDLGLLLIPLLFYVTTLPKPLGRKTNAGSDATSARSAGPGLFDRKGFRVGISCLTIVGIMFILYLPLLIGQDLATRQSFFLNDVRVGLWENFMGLASPRLWTALQFLRIDSSVIGMILVWVGLFFLLLRQRAMGGFLILWMLFTLLFYGNLHMTVTSRYFVILTPALYAALGYALACLANGRMLKTALASLLLIALCVRSVIFMYPLLQARHRHAILPAFTRWVARTVPAGSVIICADESAFFKYYTPLRVMGRPLDLFGYAPETLKDYQNRLDTLLAAGMPLYIHEGSLYAYNPDDQFREFFLKHYTLTYQGTHLYEDWHAGFLKQQVYPFALYRVTWR